VASQVSAGQLICVLISAALGLLEIAPNRNILDAERGVDMGTYKPNNVGSTDLVQAVLAIKLTRQIWRVNSWSNLKLDQH
jgi:hypothetical protein